MYKVSRVQYWPMFFVGHRGSYRSSKKAEPEKESIKNYAHSLMLFPDVSAYVNNIPRKILSPRSYCKEAYFIVLWQIINVCFCLHFQRLSIETPGALAINWLLLFILFLASLGFPCLNKEQTGLLGKTK